MRNKFPGTCYRCGMIVEIGDGHYERTKNHGWRTQHADCAIRWRNVSPAPSREEALAARGWGPDRFGEDAP